MITLTGENLTLDDIHAVAHGAPVRLSADPRMHERIDASSRRIAAAMQRGEAVYGVTTLYGGMADRAVPFDRAAELQRVALLTHRTAAGSRLDREEVRAAMLLRLNSLLQGYSAVRPEIVARYLACLNAGFTPHVHRLGSIGASGDLIPLSYIASAVLGLDPAFRVELGGEDLDCLEALDRLGLPPLPPGPKEGLALNNGTGACTGVAALALHRFRALMVVGFGVQALILQALRATSQSFHPRVHAVKPHPGQVFVADAFRALLEGSALVRDESGGARDHRGAGLIQDRYALRCLPQFAGPIVEAWATAARQIETEANSANDNPLVDPETGEVYHTGNFLAQYTAIACDSLRLQLALLVKHVDVQIAMLVAPEFNGGLPPSLVGNAGLGLNIGLKSLQIHANALAPLVQYHSRPMADLFPTHAEQFNQNINSQGMNAANLTCEAIAVAEQFMACAVVFALQAVELRALELRGHPDATPLLSPATRPLYAAARQIAGGGPPGERPLIWDDADAAVQPRIEALMADLRAPAPQGGRMLAAMAPADLMLRRFRTAAARGAGGVMRGASRLPAASAST
jgi:phenylalanine ammonia-lyase